MKILVTHTRDTFNYGSAMMAINLIYYLNNALDGDVDFFTDVRGEENLLRLIASTSLDNIYINKVLPKREKVYRFKVFTFFNDVNCNISWINKYSKGIIKNYDALIVLGGDSISEYYNKLAAVLETYKLYKISKEIPVFLPSQTIGPFTKWRKKAANRFLKKCYIYARDLWTINYLKNALKLHKVFEAADLAFLDLPKQKVKDETYNILKYYNLTKDAYITLVPSGLVNSYTCNSLNYILTWRDILLNLLKDQRLKDKKIILLPHVVRPYKVEDRVIINQILKQINSCYQERIIPIYDILLPHQARIILGNGILTITGRMHAAISTFQMVKPAISLSYGVKYGGVIEDTLGIKNLVVQATQEDQWNLGVISDEVKIRVDYVLKNYDRIQNEIKEAVKKSKEKALFQINHIAQMVQDRNQ